MLNYEGRRKRKGKNKKKPNKQKNKKKTKKTKNKEITKDFRMFHKTD